MNELLNLLNVFITKLTVQKLNNKEKKNVLFLWLEILQLFISSVFMNTVHHITDDKITVQDKRKSLI